MGQYGLTKEEVINIIGEERWNEFRHWMRARPRQWMTTKGITTISTT